MKKITTLMVMLVGCICSALAQTVATTATALDNLQSGYYVMVMKTADGSTNNEYGHFVYYGSDDKAAHFDTENANDHNLRNTKLAQSDFKYVFFVAKENNQITLKAYGTNYYWPAIPQAEKNAQKCNPGNQMAFTMAAEAQSFTYKNNADWQYLQTTATHCTSYNFFGTHYNDPSSVTVYVNINDGNQGTNGNQGSHKIGYWESGDKNKCQFQFYAVDDMPEPGEIATITYNYNYNGVTRGTSTFADARVGRAFPDVDLSNLPDYVSAEKPAGNVASDATIDIDLNVVLPFEVSTENNYHYYYLENVQGEGTRLSSNNGLNYRTSAQATTVNGVRNDLWYVTGNPFDGFRFYSVGENKEVQSNAVVSHPSLLSAHLSFSGVSNVTKVWDLIKNENGFGVCSHVGSEYATSIWPPFPTTTFENHKEYSWKYNSDRIDFEAYEPNNDAFAFRLIPATFTYALYNGGDGHTYNTFSAPFDVKVDGESDVKLYKGTADYEAKTLKMDEVAAVPAGAGVLLMGDNSEEVTFVVTSGVAALEGNALIGSTSDVTDLSDKLILGRSETTGEVGFYAAADGVTTLYANHAYLMRRSADSQLEGLSIRFGGEPTGINQLPAQKNDVNAPIYDLSGRRVLRTVKGQLYIQGGRKFMAR